MSIQPSTVAMVRDLADRPRPVYRAMFLPQQGRRQLVQLRRAGACFLALAKRDQSGATTGYVIYADAELDAELVAVALPVMATTGEVIAAVLGSFCLALSDQGQTSACDEWEIESTDPDA